jgi:hypothetical protein
MRPELSEWWADGRGRNSYTTYTTPTGSLSVYVRRNVADPSVMEIANVSTIEGWGGLRSLYRDFCRDIPAIAENILNPELDRLLARLGWTHEYRDLGGTPTRINPAFMVRFPHYAEVQSAFHAILRSRD